MFKRRHNIMLLSSPTPEKIIRRWAKVCLCVVVCLSG